VRLQATTDFLKWLETTPLAEFVSQSPWGYPAMLTLHLVSVAIVMGMITVVDLRLLGLASIKCAVSDVCREALPWTWGAFAVSAVTGVILFMAQPVKYFDNYAFRVKFLLLVIAGLNMLVFEFVTYRGVAKWDRGGPVPLAAKVAGAISLATWIAIVAYGRWTAYYML
jgi:Family of unknown function (DUF6644)